MIKLIASDLDETLLPEGTFDLNPEYYDVIRQLSDRGILFAASSGRHYSSIAKLLGPVKDDIVILAGNGSCVMWKGKPLCLREIPYETYLRALKDMREVNPDIILTDHPDCVYTDTDNEEMFRWIHDGYRVNLHRCEDLSSVGTPVLKTAMFVSSDAAEYAGQKEAAKNKAISEFLTKDLLDYYYVQQWNGKLPENYVGSDRVNTLIGLGKTQE